MLIIIMKQKLNTTVVSWRNRSSTMKFSSHLGVLKLLIPIFLLHFSLATTDSIQHNIILHCLSHHSLPFPPISFVTYFPNNPSYTPVLQSHIRNLRFNSPTTPKPVFIVTPTHFSHIQASIICCRIHGLDIRIRSGGHDYDGLSYVSSAKAPFIILDMFNLRSVDVNMEDETAWVESGATLGEVYYKIAEKSKVHGFPAGTCPTVGVGGHFSGGGYGYMMRRFGLSVDNIIDAKIVDVNGNVMERALMGEDLFWAIRGGGGASFGVIVSWKIKLVHVPEIVTVFRIEKTLEEGVSDIVHQWQFVANKIHKDLLIRVVLMPMNKTGLKTIKAKFVALFLGNKKKLLAVMNESFPEFGLAKEHCLEMSWIDSVLYLSNYSLGTNHDVLLERKPKSEKFFKNKSDYVQQPISKSGLESIWKKMKELRKVTIDFNPHGGKMSEIPWMETPFPQSR